LSCQGIGGHLTPIALQSILDGSAAPDHGDYDVIAQAINDAFVEQGLDHPVPYAEDIGMVSGGQ
jgi:hypothetical protein